MLHGLRLPAGNKTLPLHFWSGSQFQVRSLTSDAMTARVLGCLRLLRHLSRIRDPGCSPFPVAEIFDNAFHFL